MTATQLNPDSVAPYEEPLDPWYSALAGVIVTAAGLIALLGIVAVALFTLPETPSKGQNVVALATSAFGVIGAIVGAYFGVRAANRAVDKAHRRP